MHARASTLVTPYLSSGSAWPSLRAGVFCDSGDEAGAGETAAGVARGARAAACARTSPRALTRCGPQVIKAAEDSALQYMNFMNVIFAAQKQVRPAALLRDVCFLMEELVSLF